MTNPTALPGQAPVFGHTNRLVRETSPYLLQHAHNPVDWYPWGQEALGRARTEDKPILLSVGYSACHWCHVMAHESFEDAETAALMNSLFVNIKVDREERPDIDAIYMEAVQSMTGHGGWPMTVFLTPDGRPFYGGTYFPPLPRFGMPGFRQVLQAIADAWKERRRELESAGDRAADLLNRSALVQRGEPAALAPALLEQAIRGLLHSHDPREGGFGDAPKFPQPMNLEFLLQVLGGRRMPQRGFYPDALAGAGGHKDEAVTRAVGLTLTKMARGGMYDQLGGGFHRYSTDAHWLVPHFEKMLYDNAQLARVYLHAWQVTGDPVYRRVVEETLDYVLREMTSPEGGFYSTQDADSEGKEGKFFLWTLGEVTALLGAEDGRLCAAYWGVTPGGNFAEGGPGANILHVARELEQVAQVEGVTPERLRQAKSAGRQLLFQAREGRVRPGRDEKMLAEWNGLMLEALAEAGAALNREDYLDAARKAGAFILGAMVIPDDGGGLHLCRSYKDGQARLRAYLEDYAAMALGLFRLYEATFEDHWLEASLRFAGVIHDSFADKEGGAFFQTSNDHERLVTRRKDFIDSATPSGNSLSAELYLRLAMLMGRPDGSAYADYAVSAMQPMSEAMASQPGAFGRMLCALDMYLNPGQEIAIVGDPDAADTRALVAELHARYLPNSVVALRVPPGVGNEERSARIPLLPLVANRGQIGGQATAYVCRSHTCQLPVTDPAALVRQLSKDDG